MEKKEYVFPEMEVVEITEKYTILAGSPEDENEGGGPLVPGLP